MDLKPLKKSIKEKSFAPCYLFYGPEAYLLNHYLQEVIKKAVSPQFADFNFNRIEGGDFSVMDFESAVMAYPCFDERKIVLVKNLTYPKLNEETVKAIGEILKDCPDTTVVIFVYDETVSVDRKYDRLKKAVTQSGGLLCEFTEPKEADLITWVKRHFAAEKKEIETADAQYMLSVCDHAMTNLHNEIEKVCKNCETDKVTRQDMDRVIIKSLDAKVFDLTDALTADDFDGAYVLLDELLARKEEPVRIMGAVSNNFLRLYKLKSCMEAGMPLQAAGQAAGIKNTYVLNKVYASIRNTKPEYLKFAVSCCGQCDFALKNSRVDSRTSLEMFIGRLLTYRQEGKKRAYH